MAYASFRGATWHQCWLSIRRFRRLGSPLVYRALYSAGMAVEARKRIPFRALDFETFRFVAREIDDRGLVVLRYALDDAIEFVETFELPDGTRVSDQGRERIDGLLALLHWVAGVSYYKTAIPPNVAFEAGVPPDPVAALLEALYSEGLGEFAYTNQLATLPRPAFKIGRNSQREQPHSGSPNGPLSGPTLVPIGGGKDSIVALEIVRRAGLKPVAFSVGDAGPISRTASAAGLEHLVARRHLDPQLGDINSEGALNGHVPITAIISCIAVLTAALRGFDSVAIANERSASKGNVSWAGIEVNHQFSKGLRAERLLQNAFGKQEAGVEFYSVLRPASELAIARAFTRMDAYHHAFSSCNTNFRLDGSVPARRWCCDCPKCRFVFLILAPFSKPQYLREIFGQDLLDDDSQFEGFALLTATGGPKPFECVGEEEEAKAAMGMLVTDPCWRDHRIVRRFSDEVLPSHPDEGGMPADALTLSEEHSVPDILMPAVRAILGP